MLSLVNISHYHMEPLCKIYLLKGNNLVIEIKFLDPRFLSLQDFSKSQGGPKSISLQGSVFMEKMIQTVNALTTANVYGNNNN